jgi:hypothetical protein
MLLYRLDREVVNLPDMTDVLDESGKVGRKRIRARPNITDHR